MTNLTTSQFQTTLRLIESMDSLDDLVQMVRQIDALKVALESAHMFREQSIKYAKLEAEALLRVARLGGVDKLRGYHKKVAAWLADLTEDERDRFVSMCEDGLTIDNVYKREVGDDLKLQSVLDALSARRSWLLDDVKETGMVDITDFCKEVKQSLSSKPSVANDIIDGARNRLRQAGAVGVGSGSGIYVLPDVADKSQIVSALKTRFESIVNDFDSLIAIAKTAKVKFQYEDFCEDIYNRSRTTGAYCIHILIALARASLIANEDEMLRAIEQSDVYAEIKQVIDLLKCSREEAISKLYLEVTA